MGNAIGDRFELRDRLGRGGMGEVYRAIDKQTGETVAVKALNPDVLANDPNLLDRFTHESEALRRLNHPNIVHMMVAVEEQGRHYLVMEFVEGGSLRDLLNSVGQLPANEVAKIALEVADALTRAHHLGIIHRDLKPGNVLLAKDGTPRLADFGIAHMQESSHITETGILVGTVDYLSPEVCQGEQASQLSDIWSFGVMLFEMLSGKLPFEGKSLTARITAILTQPVPDLKLLSPDTPDALVDLIYRMLEKNPSQRIPSVRLVGAELEAILKGREPVSHFPAGKTEGRFSTPTPAANAPRHNLPVESTPFVGREAELVELDRLLSDPSVRLLSIVGVGGMGKTRLAIEAGLRQLERFLHGVFFVPLAPLDSIDPFISTITKSLGIKFPEAEEPLQQLTDYLRNKDLLLIMDNFEHLLEGVGLVNQILQNCPQVKVVVTSRIKLSVQNEHIFHLEGMDVPDMEHPAAAMECSAVKLFMQSARRARPGFELGADDLRYVGHICRQLGGMPLGILLASAWVEMLNLPEIVKEIEQHIDLLETSLRDVSARQQSMQSVVDYSWNILTTRERDIFHGLSIFRGGFTREAAQQVTGSTLRELMGLIDKSLLQRSPSGRYALHELLRQFGEQKLVDTEKDNGLHKHHFEYYLSLAEQSVDKTIGWIQTEWLPQMAVEFDNLRAALSWCLDSNDAAIGLRLASHLGYFWLQGGKVNEGASFLNRFLARATGPSPERASGLFNLGILTYNKGDYLRAKSLLEEGLVLFEALGDQSGAADVTLRLAWVHLALGNFDQSHLLLDRSLRLYQDLNKPEHVAYVIEWMGDLAYLEGDYFQARELLEKSTGLQRGLDDKIRLSYVLSDYGRVLIHFSELEKSKVLLKEVLTIQQQFGKALLPYSVAFVGFALLADARGQPIRAARLLGAWNARCKEEGYQVEAPERSDYEATLASLHAQMGESAFKSAWAEGAALTVEQAVELAMEDEPD